MESMNRISDLKEYYKLQPHPEGGYFCECYTSKAPDSGRPYAGSIYFLLEKDDVSHFHQIDCEEIWYYHEGCGMKITVITEQGVSEYVLGKDIEKAQNVMVVIPKGAIFAAVNLDSNDFTFVSCVTSPQFTYDGFRLVGKSEIKEICNEVSDDVLILAFEDDEI